MDILRNLYLHKYSFCLPYEGSKKKTFLSGTSSRVPHKMFYKTKSTSPRTSGSTTVTTQNDGLRSQQFYVYSIDGRVTQTPNGHPDLPPKYEDVVKDPNYVRRS